MRIEAKEVAALARAAGLTLERTVELAPYHYAAVLKTGEAVTFRQG